MFTTLTIVAAWFSFGYCVSDIIIDVAKNRQLRKSVLNERNEDSLYRNSGHYGPQD